MLRAATSSRSTLGRGTKAGLTGREPRDDLLGSHATGFLFPAEGIKGDRVPRRRAWLPILCRGVNIDIPVDGVAVMDLDSEGVKVELCEETDDAMEGLGSLSALF